MFSWDDEVSGAIFADGEEGLQGFGDDAEPDGVGGCFLLEQGNEFMYGHGWSSFTGGVASPIWGLLVKDVGR